MDLLVVVDGVTDYDSWRKVFDEDEAGDQAAKHTIDDRAAFLDASGLEGE